MRHYYVVNVSYETLSALKNDSNSLTCMVLTSNYKRSIVYDLEGVGITLFKNPSKTLGRSFPLTDFVFFHNQLPNLVCK